MILLPRTYSFGRSADLSRLCFPREENREDCGDPTRAGVVMGRFAESWLELYAAPLFGRAGVAPVVRPGRGLKRPRRRPRRLRRRVAPVVFHPPHSMSRENVSTKLRDIVHPRSARRQQQQLTPCRQARRQVTPTGWDHRRSATCRFLWKDLHSYPLRN